ncbi:MAG: hypothetical protein JWO17_3092 [Actinomycetia bacterium]|nr:hypothetical protein [Actinomycetes bacterium]
MRHSALRRAVGAGVVLAACALLLGNSVIGTTFALFNGETANANSAFAGGWIGAPSAATATASGYDVGLAWTPGTHGPVTGQQLYGVDNTTSSNCSMAYSLLATMALASTAAYTDSSRGTAANNGNWFCYRLVSTSATSWTSSLDLSAVQLGLVTTGVQITNGGGTANTIQKNDTIKLTFNQRTNLGTGNIKVCVYTTGAILLGDTQSGNACGTAADGFTVGKLTMAGATIASGVAYNSSTVALSTSAPWTMTITLAGTNGTSAMTGTPTWTLNGSSSILSFATTHQAPMCSAATSNCRPTTSTNF